MLYFIIFRLQRFEKTNEMLTNCNALSASRLKQAGVEFKKHTQLLLDMKKDLDIIFKKIRNLKTKLRFIYLVNIYIIFLLKSIIHYYSSAQYPEAFEKAQKAALAQACLEEDEDEFDNAKPQCSKSIGKDISKSTETLRPSISQVFTETAKPERKLIEPDEDMKMDLSGDTPKKIPSKLKNINNPDVEDEKKSNRNSSASSSSDNVHSGESSGECTSDTG